MTAKKPAAHQWQFPSRIRPNTFSSPLPGNLPIRLLRERGRAPVRTRVVATRPGAHHVVLTSPYVLVAPDLTACTVYLDRVAAKTAGTSRVCALEQHFKWGDTARYWPSFVIEAYTNHSAGAIFLHGLPDMPETRPHSRKYCPPGPGPEKE